MNRYTTQLGLTVIDFLEIAELIENNFKKDQPYLFQEYPNLSHKDRSYLYLHYTLNTIIPILNEGDYKNTVFYVNNNSAVPQHILVKLEDVSEYFPVIICKGPYDINCLKSESGERVELMTIINECRYTKDLSVFTERRRNDFFVKYKALKAFHKLRAAY